MGTANLDFFQEKQDVDKQIKHEPIVLRPYQVDAIGAIKKGWLGNRLGNTFRSQLLVLGTGLGKCHGAGTPILMHDGTIKNVEDVQVGDQLMGPDSRPRGVLGLARGRDQMYRIHPIKGESWTCNAPHVLSLKDTGTGEIVNIPLNQWQLETKTFRHRKKLWRATAEWSYSEPVYDPYVVGVWLGDGTRRHPQITNSDPEIVEYLMAWADKSHLTIREEPKNNTVTYNFASHEDRRHGANALRRIMKECQRTGEKRVPHQLKANARDVRLQVLAGLLDTDGCLTEDGAGYEVTFKDKGLAEDVAFLARSLGMAAYVRPKTGTIRSIGFVGQYWRVEISGPCDQIPCKVKRRKAQPRRKKKDPLRTGFTVECLGEGEYYGFEIDGDHLYLLGDFTVTHNTICFADIAQWVVKELGGRVLVLAHREELLEQAEQKMVRVFGQQINVGREQAEQRANVIVDQIVTASVATLGRSITDPAQREFKNGAWTNPQRPNDRLMRFPEEHFKLIIIDEAHHATAMTYQNVLKRFPGAWVLGVTATPKRSDKESLHEVFEKVAYKMDIVDGTKQGYLTPVVSHRVSSKTRLDGVRTTAGDYNLKDLAERVNNEERNNLVVETYLKYCPDQSCIVYATDLSHARALDDEFQKVGVPAHAITGDMNKDERKAALKAFMEGKVKVLTNYAVLTEGFDCERLAHIINARPTKSPLLLTQIAGRLTRLAEDKRESHFYEIIDNHSEETATCAEIFGFEQAFDCMSVNFLQCIKHAENCEKEKDYFDPWVWRSIQQMLDKFKKATPDDPQGGNIAGGGAPHFDSRYRYYRTMGGSFKLVYTEKVPQGHSLKYSMKIEPDGLGGYTSTLNRVDRGGNGLKLYQFESRSLLTAAQNIESCVARNFSTWDVLLWIDAPWRKRAAGEPCSEKQWNLIQKFRLNRGKGKAEFSKIQAMEIISRFFTK